jgi:autotransporter passenger strand-loop-strand repeat protein
MKLMCGCVPGAPWCVFGHGQTLTVSSGQTSGGVLVLSGGILNILPGGTAIGITVSSNRAVQ